MDGSNHSRRDILKGIGAGTATVSIMGSASGAGARVDSDRWTGLLSDISTEALDPQDNPGVVADAKRHDGVRALLREFESRGYSEAGVGVLRVTESNGVTRDIVQIFFDSSARGSHRERTTFIQYNNLERVRGTSLMDEDTETLIEQANAQGFDIVEHDDGQVTIDGLQFDARSSSLSTSTETHSKNALGADLDGINRDNVNPDTCSEDSVFPSPDCSGGSGGGGGCSCYHPITTNCSVNWTCLAASIGSALLVVSACSACAGSGGLLTPACAGCGGAFIMGGVAIGDYCDGGLLNCDTEMVCVDHHEWGKCDWDQV